MTDVVLLPPKDHRSDRKRAASMIYFLLTHDGERCKIGHTAEGPKRAKSQCVSNGWEFFAAIEGARTHEQECHRHFQALRVPGTKELFYVQGELAAYLEWLSTRAFAALTWDEWDSTYPAACQWPWQPWREGAVDANGYEFLPLSPRYLVPSVRKPRSMSNRVLATIRSDSDEWHTPAIYVEAAREVMGGIDLDPASNPLANRTVRASAIHTKAEDGLRYQWQGRVWLNPPYGSEGPKFVAHLLAEYVAGRVSEAVLCLNAHGTDTRWFQPLWEFPICFTHHRPRFVGGTKDKTPDDATPTTGIVFPYVGPNRERFTEVFRQFGAVTQSVLPATTPAEEFRQIQKAGRDWELEASA